MAYLNLGTGLAAGLVLGGRLWRGSRGDGGRDRAHPGRPGRRRSARCGQRGCLEVLASGSARRPPVADRASASRQDLFEAAAAGDAARDRGAPAASSTTLPRPSACSSSLSTSTIVVIGGGITSLGDVLLDAIRGVLDGVGRGSRSSSPRSTCRAGARWLPPGRVAAVGAALLGEPAADRIGPGLMAEVVIVETARGRRRARAPSSSRA